MVSRRRFWGYLRVQVLLLMLVVLMLPLGGVGWLYYSTLSSDLRDIEKAHALEVSDSAHRLLSQLGEQLSGSVITNAKWKDNWTAVKDRDIAWIKENVDVSLEVIPNLSFLATADNEGNVLTQAGDIPEFMGKLKDPSIVQKVKKDTDVYGLIQTSKGIAIIAASQITDEQRKEVSPGMLIFGRFLNDDTMKGIGAILNAGLAIRTFEGQKLGSDPETIGLLANAAPLPTVEQEPEFQSNDLKGTRFSEVKSGHPGMSGQSIAELVVSVPAKASGTVQKEMVRLSGIAALLAIVLIVLIAVVLRRRIIVPLVRFESFLKEVSAGHLSGTLSDKVRRRGDEIGSIARSLQEMVEHLKQLVSGIRSTANVTSVAASQLTGDADQAAEGANRIAESMREVAAGADSQALGMKRGAEVTREIRDSMMTIGDRTISVAAVAEQATQHAVEGNDTIQHAVKQMERIAVSVDGSVRDAHILHTKSEQIGKMVEAISAIAYRTNLLALNANIEASRAGEQGRGFSVVAGEVRKLALQADETASEITHGIEEIQSGITSVMKQIEEGYREVQDGTAIVREAGNAFQGISLGIADMEGELREIASAGQEIGARIEELSTLVGQTEAISEASADRSQDVAGIAESQMNSVRRVAEAMGSLSERIRELEQAVNRFK
ncbi:methyl-accepting chemotaxis protein [Cohnella silvisoli]|uniref:Methyl-accepting chemotaxis protein n=1 Tax=Cohnella silvisoli TaxID=2873699 RepID=A0ABV1KWI3_9BACL|nr:methyl-accepting chemotaxis protein [Cohnella silvisoli]MCD9023995.1 HAMP domain-containing protein [Cohnella silvisoli]